MVMQANDSDTRGINPAEEYDSKAAAELLGYSPATLRTWKKEGKGPRFQQLVPRGKVTYLGRWLIQFVEQGTRSSSE